MDKCMEKNPAVIQLSQDLRNLNIHTDVPDKRRFRSVNSVSLKLANIKKSDQNFAGRGMRDGGKLEKELWDKYHTHRDTLAKEAYLIRQHYLRPTVELESYSKAPFQSEYLFRCHKNREGDPFMIKAKKEYVMSKYGKLECEICGFNSVSFFGELGSDLMEIHDEKEFRSKEEFYLKNIGDFIVVCCNCHKVLDENYGLLNSRDIKNIIR